MKMKCIFCQTDIRNIEGEEIHEACKSCQKKAYEIGKSIMLRQVIEGMSDAQLMYGFGNSPISQKKMYMSEMKKRGLR